MSSGPGTSWRATSRRSRPSAPEPAPRWRRAAARVVDTSIVAFAQLTVMVLGGAALVGPGGARYLFAVLLTAYELLFVARLGQTPAKDWLNVKVATHPGDATPGLTRAARRWFLVLLALLVPNLWVTLGLLVVVGTPTLLGPRRGLHDLVAGTWVVDYDADEHDDVPDADFERLDRLRRDRRLLRFREEDPPA